MISLSPTLLQAATAWGGRPVARATLEDRRLRWSPLHTWPADDASPTTMYHNGSYLLRARSDGGGQVWVARVSDPAGQAGWEQWLPAASGARPHSDVALTWRMPATWLMLYEGAGGTALWRTSSDHGTMSNPDPTHDHGPVAGPHVRADDGLPGAATGLRWSPTGCRIRFTGKRLMTTVRARFKRQPRAMRSSTRWSG